MLINSLIVGLCILPIFGVISDFKTGKIKNLFIYPSIILIFILTFFIEGFYNEIQNLYGMVLIILFGFIFYISNRWGAGDGKYIILLGLSTLIISFLKGIDGSHLNTLFFITFGIFFIQILWYILKNSHKFIRIIKYKYVFTPIDILFIVSILLLLYSIIYFINLQNYTYLFIIIFASIFIPFAQKIVINKYIKIIFILFVLCLIVYLKNYYTLLITIIFIIIFEYLNFIFTQILDIIDTKKINILNLKQGDILTKDSIDIINTRLEIEFLETPLQGNEVFEIIGAYKQGGVSDKKETFISIYKSLQIGPVMYISYILTICFIIWN